MKPFSLFLLAFLILRASATQAQAPDKIVLSSEFRMQKLTPHAWVHETIMESEGFGKFWCNGMVYVADGKCLVFDTPATDSLSEVLIAYLENVEGLKIAGVVANHYHADCVGGLQAFHQRGIPSYSSRLTAELARKEGLPVPQITFKKKMKLDLGTGKALLYYPGAAHAPDNIVAYLPSEKVLFGGCMVKSKKSGKGYLGVADLDEWPKTLDRVRKRYGDATWVIPGHGKIGGLDLLDDTVRIISSPGE